MDWILDILRLVFTNPDVLQFLGVVIAAMLLWILKQCATWMGLKLHADRLDMLASAVDKAMTFAIVKAEDVIAEKGWNALDSRIAVINAAVPVLQEKFRDTLRQNGIDLNDPAHRKALINQMERMFPDVAARAAASPVTPPAPVTPAVVVSNPGIQ